jgi:carnitine O-acetyltransferase
VSASASSCASSLPSIPVEWRALKLFASCQALPPLPVPPLAQTVAAYERSVQPLLRDDAERARVRQLCAAFVSSAAAQRWQRALEQRASRERNWHEEWWLEYGYLKPRYGIAGTISFYAVFDADVAPGLSDPCVVAGLLLTRVANYRRLLLADKLEPEFMGKVPLEMSQIARLFTTVRHPGQECDRLVSPPCTDDLVVIVKHQHYVVSTVHECGAPLTPAELALQIRRCHSDAAARSHALPPSVGMLTAGGRTRWANARDALMKDHTNRQTMRTIDGAFFVVALDDEAPATDDEAAALAIAGNGHNRWYDKLCTLVVFANGRFAGNGEHSAVDAPATNTIFSFITKTNLTLDAPAPVASALPAPRALRWNVTADVLAQIGDAAKEYDALRGDLCITLLAFREWGREHLKARRASPDSVVQMALQLTQMMLHANTVATYETAQTRQFAGGRTETVRSASIESKRWCEATVAGARHSDAELAALLRDAIASHNAQMARCTNGQGIDRHLMGLRIQSQLDGEPMPALFDDVFSRSTTYHLSTSQVHFPRYTGGFSAATADGYGVCYSVQPELLRFSIAAWKSSKVADIHKFKATLIAALRRVDELLAISAAAKL